MLQRVGEKGKERRELIRRMDQQRRIEKLIEDRTKSANERELERYADEDREAMIKERLEFARKKRDHEINFEHNSLDTPNIMKAKWEVMKEPNQFSKKSDMFTNHKSILKNNNKLLKSSNKLMKGGNMFKI